MKLSKRVKNCEELPTVRYYPAMVEAERQGKTIYHLNLGQPDIVTPEAFFETVRAFREPVLSYGPAPGDVEFIDAVRRYYARLGVSLERDDVQATAGGSEALLFALQCIAEDGDEILLAEPFYTNYSTLIRSVGAKVRPIPTSAEEGYRFVSREKIEPLINERTRAILITDPGNPTGVVLTEDERRILVDIVKEHDLFLIADEVYREFVYGGEALSTFASFEDARENVVITDSVSKRFSACGARVGALISRNREFMGEALKLCQGRICAATLDQAACVALYNLDPSYFDAVREEYKRRRDTCVEAFRKIPGAVFEEPKGAFYMMVKLPVDSTDALQTWLLKEWDDHGDTVAFAPGDGFYETPGKGADEIRIAYVLNCEDLKRGIELIGLGIEAYNRRKG